MCYYTKSCEIQPWIFQNTINLQVAKKPITFHCSINQNYLAPIPQAQLLSVSLLVSFWIMYITYYIGSHEKGTESAAGEIEQDIT